MKQIIKHKLWLLLLLWAPMLKAQVVQPSHTSSAGAGLSVQGNTSHFGVAGQYATESTTGGNYTLHAGFVNTLRNSCAKPFNLKVDKVFQLAENNHTAELSWSVSGHPQSIEIRYKTDGALAWTTITTTGNTYQLTGLLDGQKYLVRLRAVCGSTFFSAFSEILEFITEGSSTCQAPVITESVSISDSEQQVKWTSTGADSYDIRYRLKGNLTWTFVTGITANLTTLSGLASGMIYQAQVRSVCNDVQTPYTDIYEFTTDGTTVCNVPADILHTEVTSNSANLSWTHAGAESYQIRYRIVGTVIWTSLSTTATTISITDLDPGTAYVYNLRAVCNASSGLNSLYTDVKQFETTGEPSCEVPENFAATTTSNGATITWAAADGALSYQVRYRVQGTTIWTNTQTNTNSIVLSALSSGKGYQLQVRSVCNEQATRFSLYSATFALTTTGAVECNAPNGLTATATTTSATLAWNEVSGAVSYQVRYRVEGTAVWTNQSTANTSLDITSLVSGMPYMWSVRSACNTEGTLASVYAANAFFETQGEVTCAIPANVSVSNITDQSADVSWTVNANEYLLRYRLSSTTIWTVIRLSTTSVKLNNLESGMPYQLQVKSVCAADGSLQSLYTDLLSFETSGTVSCEIPVGLFVNNITSNTATLNWAEIDAAYEYLVRYRIKGTALWTTVTANTNSLSLTGLEAGMPYQFAVRANCSLSPVVTSVFSVPVEFTTFGLPSCDVPFGFGHIAEENEVEINWTSTGALSYDVRYRVSGSTIWNNLNVLSNTLYLGSLNSGTQYQYQVRSVCAVNGTVRSVFSDVKFFTTSGSVACEMPLGINVNSVTDNSAQLQWPSASGAIEYQVQYRVKGTTLWNQLSTSSASVNLSSLSAGMPYQFRLRSICSADKNLVSPYSAIFEFSTTGITACEVPFNLRTSELNFTDVSLAWTKANGALSYEVLYRKRGDIIWIGLSTSTETISINGLPQGTTYDWRVRSICSADNALRSLYSSVSSFTTPQQESEGGRGSRTDSEEQAEEFTIGEEESFSDVEIVLYPNPFTEKLTIRIVSPQADVYMLSMYNMSGQRVQVIFEGELQANEEAGFEWLALDKPSGMYVLKIISKKGFVINRKVILTKSSNGIR
jgi:hypothetical protein